MSVANQIEEESNDLNKAITVGAQYYIFESLQFCGVFTIFYENVSSLWTIPRDTWMILTKKQARVKKQR